MAEQEGAVSRLLSPGNATVLRVQVSSSSFGSSSSGPRVRGTDTLATRRVRSPVSGSGLLLWTAPPGTWGEGTVVCPAFDSQEPCWLLEWPDSGARPASWGPLDSEVTVCPGPGLPRHPLMRVGWTVQ